MTDGKIYTGVCFCGSVKIEVAGEPAAMGYCHCDDCRLWSASPLNGFSLWSPESVKITQGEDKINSYAKTENSIRKWCASCGGHLFTEHPGFELIDVFSAVIPSLEFEPALHVFYSERVIRLQDGLPKQKDMPAEMGGSGELIPE